VRRGEAIIERRKMSWHCLAVAWFDKYEPERRRWRKFPVLPGSSANRPWHRECTGAECQVRVSLFLLRGVHPLGSIVIAITRMNRESASILFAYDYQDEYKHGVAAL
jgi:hypothetical protein